MATLPFLSSLAHQKPWPSSRKKQQRQQSRPPPHPAWGNQNRQRIQHLRQRGKGQKKKSRNTSNVRCFKTTSQLQQRRHPQGMRRSQDLMQKCQGLPTRTHHQCKQRSQDLRQRWQGLQTKTGNWVILFAVSTQHVHLFLRTSRRASAPKHPTQTQTEMIAAGRLEYFLCSYLFKQMKNALFYFYFNIC